jgi:uncharacterized protein
MTTESKQKQKQNVFVRHPLGSFFVLSYLFFLIAILIIWAVTSLVSVSDFGMGLLIAFGSWTPNLAAVIITGLTGGKREIRTLFAGWMKWRVSPWLYLFGFAPILTAFLSAGLYSLIGNVSVPEPTNDLTTSSILLMIFLHTIQGATGEELGWRGFALPNLQKRFNSLTSAIILGLVISGWHGILHLASPTGIPEWQFVLLLVSYSILITWAYNTSRGSVWIATLFHFAFNFSLDLVSARLGLIPLENLFAMRTAIYTALAVILTLITGKSLSKKSISSNK